MKEAIYFLCFAAFAMRNFVNNFFFMLQEFKNFIIMFSHIEMMLGGLGILNSFIEFLMDI